MENKEITREEVAKLSKSYAEILEKEPHHNHSIVRIDGILRWKGNEYVRQLIDNQINLNELIVLFRILGYDKRSEIYRKLYREMGYSLSGYYDVFYSEY